MTSKSSNTRPLYSIALLLLVAVALFFVVEALPFEALGELQFRRVVWWTVPMLVGMQLVFLLSAVEIWRRIVRVLTRVDMTFVSAFTQIAAVTVGKYVPGKVWGFVARAGDMHRYGIPLHLSAMCSVVEQIMLLAGAVPIAMIAAMLAFPAQRFAIVTLGVLSLIGVVVITARIPDLTRWLLRRRGESSIPERIDGYQPLAILRFVIAYAVLWGIGGIVFATIYYAMFDVAVTAERTAALVLANTLAITLGFFAFFAPGGIGVREAIAAGVLAGFVPLREALLLVVAYRGWMILFDGVNGVLLFAREASLAARKSG